MNNSSILYLVALLFMSGSTFAQFTEVSFSSKVVFSDIETWENVGSFGDPNSWKYSKGFALGTNYEVWKNTKNSVSIRANLFYNERKALEYFPFVGGMNLVKWPTSPQSDLFDNDNFDPAFKHLPNFKYLHLELLPTYSFSIGEKWQIQSGIGMSGGVLLNRTQVIFDPTDFPAITEAFNRSTEVKDIEYHRWDVALLGSVGVRYHLSSKLAVDISSGLQYSFIDLNDVSRGRYSLDEMKWIIVTPGIGMVYKIQQKGAYY